MKNQKPNLKERIVEISKLKILSFKKPLLKLEISCSSGTYIRSIARDLGIKTDYCAHLFSLKRKSIDKFKLINAYNLNNVKSGKFKIISAYNALNNISSIEIHKKFYYL